MLKITLNQTKQKAAKTICSFEGRSKRKDQNNTGEPLTKTPTSLKPSKKCVVTEKCTKLPSSIS